MFISAFQPRLRLGAAVAALAASFALTGMGKAESLWDHRDASSAFLYTDNVAADVGDSLTVLITDTSSFAKTGKRELDRSSTGNATMTLTQSISAGTGSGTKGTSTTATPTTKNLIPSLDFQQDSSRQFSTNSNYTGSVTFVDSITTTVIDKLPNGNLVIAGRSERDVAGENVVTILTGIVRPEDISGTNAIASTRIANFRLFYENKGIDEEYTVMGWLTRIINCIWPF